MSDLRFESLSERHLPQILEIERESQSSPWSEQSFRNELDHRQGVFVVAFFGAELVGYAAAWVLADEAHVVTIAVRPGHRRQGLGRSLMDEVLRRSVAAGAVCSTLEVRQSNEAAIQLYRSMGFGAVGVRRGYYPDNREDAVVMWLHDLTPWGPK